MRIKAIILALGLLALTGCAVNKDMYHWGNYNHTLYDYTKEPSEETFKLHLAELNKIVVDAKKNSKQVPPGVYFELGMMEAEKGRVDLGIQHLNKELELYPESAKFVALAKKELGK
ncbi:DUF4810 domain-containing protein [Parashewanella tropica]|uniref:DUF4810 domain-containing protein n=1 Tax=Parashewanella tropica TaxID=2547970 RepID=UPI00105A6B4E|nr:DUF4810 domain-containing protein [Parashewanella tropica]